MSQEQAIPVEIEHGDGIVGTSGTGHFVQSALPMEVARRVTCIVLPSISAAGGNVLTWPSQDPARVFSWSKDFWASD